MSDQDKRVEMKILMKADGSGSEHAVKRTITKQ